MYVPRSRLRIMLVTCMLRLGILTVSFIRAFSTPLAHAAGNVYYVDSNNGSDDNTGQSPADTGGEMVLGAALLLSTTRPSQRGIRSISHVGLPGQRAW